MKALHAHDEKRAPPRRLTRAIIARQKQLAGTTMSVTQNEKAQAFAALHRGPAFVLPNPWDVASARALAGLGFLALATSSGASGWVLGRREGELTRDETLSHARAIVAATDLPISVDLEKGFGDEPAVVAETIRLAAETGVVGGSIEDASGDRTRPLFDIGFATERVAAAADAARKLQFKFTLTARAENYRRGNPDLDDTIRRLQAFEAAGADVLFAPGLPDLHAVRAVCAAVSKPVNFMAGLKSRSFTVADLRQAGVRRISLGSALYRTAMIGFMSAAREINDDGTFGFVDWIS